MMTLPRPAHSDNVGGRNLTPVAPADRRLHELRGLLTQAKTVAQSLVEADPGDSAWTLAEIEWELSRLVALVDGVTARGAEGGAA